MLWYTDLFFENSNPSLVRREEIRQRREKIKLKQEKENQRRYEEKMIIEKKKADEAQLLIEKMEREEAALIEVLKLTQKQQEEVYRTYIIKFNMFIIFASGIC